jgi:hypothetical protein
MRIGRIGLAAMVVVGLAACGGDDADEAAGTDDATTTTAGADEATTTTAEAAPTGDDFCAQVQAVKDLSIQVGLGPGSVPGSAELQQIRDGQAAIDPPAEIADTWAKNLEYTDEGIAITKDAEGHGASAYDEPYLSRQLELAQKQSPGAMEIDGYVKEHCGFSTQLTG